MSQDVHVATGSDQPLPVEGPDGSACSTGGSCSTGACWVTRTIRAATALLVLGAAGAYGAVTIHPELANYAWFVPETADNSRHCASNNMSGGCPLSGGCSVASSEAGCCAASTGCPLSQPAESTTPPETVAVAGEYPEVLFEQEVAAEDQSSESQPTEEKPAVDRAGEASPE